MCSSDMYFSNILEWKRYYGTTTYYCECENHMSFGMVCYHMSVVQDYEHEKIFGTCPAPDDTSSVSNNQLNNYEKIISKYNTTAYLCECGNMTPSCKHIQLFRNVFGGTKILALYPDQ